MRGGTSHVSKQGKVKAWRVCQDASCNVIDVAGCGEGRYNACIRAKLRGLGQSNVIDVHGRLLGAAGGTQKTPRAQRRRLLCTQVQLYRTQAQQEAAVGNIMRWVRVSADGAPVPWRGSSWKRPARGQLKRSLVR